MKTCIYCGEKIDSEDEVDGPAHEWCALGLDDPFDDPEEADPQELLDND